jgi:transcriptional regulator with GAF, ATPase, and Fis domain
MEGTIHIKNKQEQEYWIEGALVDKVTTSPYSFNKFGREAYVHYQSGEVETIPCVVVIEVLGTYKMEPVPIPEKEEEKAKPSIFNKDDVLKVLRDCNGSRKKAAEVFGVSARTLYRRMKEFEII